MKRLLATLCIWLCAAAALAQWVQMPSPRRASQHAGYLGDIVSRVGSPGTYMDADLVTSAHECTHDINSDLRQTAGAGMNCCYVLNGWSARLREPKVTLREIAAKVPLDKRGRGFQLYMVVQRRDWDNEPLYILDELSAYLNGATVAAELKIPDRFRDSYQSSVEFIGYADILAQSVPADYDAEPLRKVIAFQKIRCGLLLAYGKKQGWFSQGGVP